MAIDINKVHEWPRSMQMMVFAAVFLLVYYVGFRWDIASIQMRLNDSRQQESDLKQQYESVVNKEESIVNDLSQSPALLDLIKKWKGRLVNYADITELLNDILKMGAKNNLYFSLFSPGSELKSGGYTKVPIKVVAVGGYHQIAQFISQVVNMPWIVVVGDFVLSLGSKNEGGSSAKEEEKAGATDGLLTAQLMLDVYYLPGTNK